MSFSRFTVLSWLRPTGVPAADKFVLQTHRPGTRTDPPTVQTHGSRPQRSHPAAPVRAISKAAGFSGSAPSDAGPPGSKPVVPALTEAPPPHPFVPFQKPQAFRDQREGRWIGFVHQTLLGLITSSTMPPTSASAPTAGEMK